MSVRNQLKLLVGGLNGRRGEPGSDSNSSFREFLDQSRLVAGLIFVVTVAAIVIVSSAGMRVLDLPVLPNQIAPVRIVAGFPFSYVSTERTRTEREQSLSRLPPIYRLDSSNLDRFEAAARDLLGKLAAFEAPLDDDEGGPDDAPGAPGYTGDEAGDDGGAPMEDA